jgi:uncharacterized membrane protein (UPF0127 family)
MSEQTRVVNERSGAVLAESLVSAHDSQSRRKGWLGRTSAPLGEAIWILPCEAIHCFFMHFPIDVAFLDRELRVVQVRRAVKPWRIAVCLKAYSVMEFPEGVIDATATVPGDKIVLQRIAGSPLET